MFAAVGGISGLDMSIVDIVENPDSAPLAVAGMLLGARIRTPREYALAAGFRRGLSDDYVVKSMGDLYKNKDKPLTNIVRVCRKT